MKKVVLTDVATATYVEKCSLGPDYLPDSPQGWSVLKTRLYGGKSDGVDVLVVDNGALRFTVVPTRGMGIGKAWLGDLELGWQAPITGPVHPQWVNLMDPSGIGWLDGFDELVVRCGLESNGAPQFFPNGKLEYPLHGKIANLPAHKVEVEVHGGGIIVRGVVDEARMFGQKLRLTTTIRTAFGAPSLTIEDQVQNIGGIAAELELLYHINVGAPLLNSGSRVVLPTKLVVPRDAEALKGVDSWSEYGPPTCGVKEQVFFCQVAADGNGITQALLRNAAGDRGLSVEFDVRQLPFFTLWKNPAALSDGYVTGLEPATGFPNVKSFEKARGRVISLAPWDTRMFLLTLTACGDKAAVAASERSIAAIQAETQPQVLRALHPDWCVIP